MAAPGTPRREVLRPRQIIWRYWSGQATKAAPGSLRNGKGRADYLPERSLAAIEIDDGFLADRVFLQLNARRISSCR
eukprot:scaffold599184_cov43-Prasinocladus_malaysianus.AAC.1